MATVHFTRWLEGIAPGEPVGIDGETVGLALDRLFADNAQARNYVLDEQGRLRKHVCIFLDGERLAHDNALAAPLQPQSEVYVMQALSGG
jgi:molybdopterin synthase sulfur carrier subunit